MEGVYNDLYLPFGSAERFWAPLEPPLMVWARMTGWTVSVVLVIRKDER